MLSISASERNGLIAPMRLVVDPLPGNPLVVETDLLKQHLAVDHDETDELIEIYLKSAIGWAETVTHRSIVSRGHKWILGGFPLADREIRLPRGLASAVSGISYASGATTVSLTGPTSGSPAGSDYREDLTDDAGGILLPAYGGSWPSADRDAVAPVTITFTAGWQSGAVPHDIQAAIMLRVAASLENRGDDEKSADLSACFALLSGWTLSRWH